MQENNLPESNLPESNISENSAPKKKGKLRIVFEVVRQKADDFADVISAILVCLFPIVTGAIFFRVFEMGGAPAWFFVLQGILFLGSLIQFAQFTAFGLFQAFKNIRNRKDG